MSRREPALTLVVVLCFVTLVFAAPLLALPARGYGEHVFQASPVVGSGDPYYSVYSGTTLAESISVPQSYTLTNVTLRVRNDGGPMNALVVSIHPDDPVRHVPVLSTSLASSSWVTPNNTTSAINWSFPFNPSPILQAGSVYWILAQNTAPNGPPTNGYEWHESNADVYPDGSAFVLDTDSGVWTGLPYDLFFITYGRERPSNLTIAVTADRRAAQPADRVTFTVDVANRGTEAAARAWINTSLPAELTNVSTVFPDIQPTSPASFPNLTFLNVANGPHAFTVSAQVGIGTAPGSVLTVRVSLDYLNATGALTRGRQASTNVTIGLVTKQLYLGSTSTITKLLTTAAPTNAVPATTVLLSGAPQPIQFLLSPALAEPFQELNVSVSLWASTQKPSSQTYHLNVSLLDNGTPVASIFPVFTLTPSTYHVVNFTFAGLTHQFPFGHRIRLSLWNLGGGGGSTDNLYIRYNATTYQSKLDVVTPTYVAVDQLLLEDPESNATVWSPLDPIEVFAKVSDPFGESRIAGVWINITSPQGDLAAAGEMHLLEKDPSALPAWALFNYTLAPPLATGAYRIDVEAMEDNGVVDLARGFADVASPSFTFEDATTLGRVQAGGAFAYRLYFNNSGTGAAGQVWINETLPAEVAYAGSSLPYTAVVGNTYMWALTNVGLGNHTLEIDVTVPSSNVVPAWVRDNATLEYTDLSGHMEAPLAAAANVFLNGPVFTVAVSGAPAAGIHANETAVYAVHLVNTGADSGTVWMNDTLPGGFIYLSDNASIFGATLTQAGRRLRYEFPGIPAGATWTIDITARAAPVLTWNQSYVNGLEVNYTSANGYPMPEERASASLQARAPSFSLAQFSFGVSTTDPGSVVSAILRLRNDGNEVAPQAWINLTLDSRLAIRDASCAFSTGLGTAQLALVSVGLGESVVYLNLTVRPSTPDGGMLQVAGNLTGVDAFGNPLPTLGIPRTSVLVSAPALIVRITPPQFSIEAGTTTTLVVQLSNLGSGNAAAAWLNVSIPGALQYESDSFGVVPAIVGSLYSYLWVSPSPVLGAHAVTSFLLSVAARPATPNGTAADLGFTLDYEGANLLISSGPAETIHSLVVAPALVLGVDASDSTLAGSKPLTYTLSVTNAGGTMARSVSVRDDIDPHLTVVSYSSAVPASGNQTLVWNFIDLGPGESVTMSIIVSAKDGLASGAEISNSLVVSYSNSLGTPLASIHSTPVIVHVAQDFTPLFWTLGVAAVVGLAASLVRFRTKRVEIEDVFLVYRDGVLISHLSRSLIREKDEDVLSGMLTAVQEFVREAFQYGEHRDLQQLDFGEYRILIERGHYVYLAVVYSGDESPALRKKVQAVIALIERQFGSVLEKWEGDMDEVMGARDLIRDALLGTNGHGREERTIPQYE